MKDIKEELQDKFYWITQNIEQLCRYAEKHHEYSAEDTESINLLIKECRELFENLIKENEELKAYKNLGKIVHERELKLEKENEELKKSCEAMLMKHEEIVKTCVSKAQQESQAIDPSVLEKLDKLQERCIFYKAQLNLLGKQQDATQRNLNEIKKQLAIYDKALDKALSELEKYVGDKMTKDELKKCYLRESENKQ